MHATAIKCNRLTIQLQYLQSAVFMCCSINQSINLYRAIVQRRVLQCGYAESKRNVLRRILNVLTDGAVRQFSWRYFHSLGAATEKRRAAVSKLCGGTDRNFCWLCLLRCLDVVIVIDSEVFVLCDTLCTVFVSYKLPFIFSSCCVGFDWLCQSTEGNQFVFQIRLESHQDHSPPLCMA